MHVFSCLPYICHLCRTALVQLALSSPGNTSSLSLGCLSWLHMLCTCAHSCTRVHSSSLRGAFVRFVQLTIGSYERRQEDCARQRQGPPYSATLRVICKSTTVASQFPCQRTAYCCPRFPLPSRKLVVTAEDGDGVLDRRKGAYKAFPEPFSTARPFCACAENSASVSRDRETPAFALAPASRVVNIVLGSRQSYYKF